MPRPAASSLLRHVIGQTRCALLRTAPARPRSLSSDVEIGDHAFDIELLLVSFPTHAHYVVVGQRQAASLQIFLSKVLGSFPSRVRVGSSIVERRCADEFGRAIEASVEKNRAHYRFQSVGQDRGSPEAATLELSLTQA